MKNIEGEIFVVDNQSTDKSRDFFCNKFQEVNFIWNTENEGFAIPTLFLQKILLKNVSLSLNRIMIKLPAE
jgi:hypothetical protein